MVGLIVRKRKLGKPIYKVLTLRVKDTEPGHFNREMFGWYHKKRHACKAIEYNVYDMTDGRIFNYACVLKSYQGAYGLNDEEVAWYMWLDGKECWIPIPMLSRPSALDGWKLN